MATVKTEIDQAAGLTVHVVEGDITAEEIHEAVARYYKGIVTKLILWNFQAATLTQIPTNEFSKLASLGKVYGPVRQGGKTALVFSCISDFGLGRMFESLCDIHDKNITFKSFMDLPSALAWLKSVEKEIQ